MVGDKMAHRFAHHLGVISQRKAFLCVCKIT